MNVDRNKMTAMLLSIEGKKPEEFWYLVKRMQHWGKPDADIDFAIPPETWLHHFNSLLDDGEDTPLYFINELASFENIPAFSEVDFKIETSEIETALKRLNKQASPSADKVSGNLLFTDKDDLMPVFKLFLNKLFSHSTQPEKLNLNILKAIYKKGDPGDPDNILKAIYKKGDPGDPDNYRGIAVGTALSKLFCLIILNRLEGVVQSLHPVSPNQIGFKKGHLTSDHIRVLKTVVDKIVKSDKGNLFVAFIDFRKAYDRINRSLLLLKLRRLGVKHFLNQCLMN